MKTETTVVLDSENVGAAIHQMAREIVGSSDDIRSIVLLGILKRGRPLADRIAGEIQMMAGIAPRVGSLATTLYRDDVRSGKRTATSGSFTHFSFDVDGVTVILVDDVLSTGRTVRAAMDEVMDYGRPKRIQLACLVDRGGRELPIRADFLGWSLATDSDDHVSVHLRETDGEDAVLLEAAPNRKSEPGE